MSASPEFFNPVGVPAYSSPRIHLAITEPAADDSYYSYSTPTGAVISCFGDAATCPPAPRKPRPPASACRKRLFAAADVVTIRFDDLEAIFRPAPSRRCDQLTGRASTKRGAILS